MPHRETQHQGMSEIDWATTGDWYDANADSFTKATLAIDTSAILSRFTKGLRPGGKVLDIGCGAGRDTRQLLDMGYKMEAVDASLEMCRATQHHTQGKAVVRHSRIQDLPDMPGAWDGIWMTASLIHVPKEDWLDILSRLGRSLAPAGRFYVCVKEGDGERIDPRGRPMSDASLEDLTDLLKRACPTYDDIDAWTTQSAASAGDITRWANVIVQLR